ncbi:hypothetical protein [Spirosoma gilvum]
MKTLEEFGYNGYQALKYVLEKTYGSVNQAVASLSLFTHPATVQQTNNQALFRIVRDPNRRGEVLETERLMLCDNSSPAMAFCWANKLKRNFGKGESHLQFNHIYRLSRVPEYYTSLANICVTPTYIAKLTDSKGSEVEALLQYRSRVIYNFLPKGYPEPVKPIGYDDLQWVPFLQETSNVIEVISKQMHKSSKSRPAKSAELYGWLGTNPSQNIEELNIHAGDFLIEPAM